MFVLHQRRMKSVCSYGSQEMFLMRDSMYPGVMMLKIEKPFKDK